MAVFSPRANVFFVVTDQTECPWQLEGLTVPAAAQAHDDFLCSRIHVLEEQLREMDQRSDEKLADEQKRHRDLLARMEREKQLEVENYAIR
jgi:hypothetical protein